MEAKHAERAAALEAEVKPLPAFSAAALSGIAATTERNAAEKACIAAQQLEKLDQWGSELGLRDFRFPRGFESVDVRHLCAVEEAEREKRVAAWQAQRAEMEAKRAERDARELELARDRCENIVQSPKDVREAVEQTPNQRWDYKCPMRITAGEKDICFKGTDTDGKKHDASFPYIFLLETKIWQCIDQPGQHETMLAQDVGGDVVRFTDLYGQYYEFNIPKQYIRALSKLERKS